MRYYSFDSERSQNWNLSAAVTTANNKNAMLCLRRHYMLVYFSVCIFLMNCWLQINNNNKKQLPQSHLRSFCGATTATWLAHYNISDLSAFFGFCKPNYKSHGGELIHRRLHKWHASVLTVCTCAQLHICMTGKLLAVRESLAALKCSIFFCRYRC